MAQFDVVIIFQVIWPLTVLLLLFYHLLLNWVALCFFSKKVGFKKEKFLVKS